MNNDDIDVFVDGQWAGTAPSVKIEVDALQRFVIKAPNDDGWPDTVLEDILDAEYVYGPIESQVQSPAEKESLDEYIINRTTRRKRNR